MDYELIMKRLGEYKETLKRIRDDHYRDSEDVYNDVYQKIITAIKRIYPEPNDKMKQFFSSAFAARVGADDHYWQQRYIEQIDEAIRAIDTMTEEFELFGFGDFKPVKEKIETTVGIGKETFGFMRKKTTEKK